jgi:hypothetical protein
VKITAGKGERERVNGDSEQEIQRERKSCGAIGRQEGQKDIDGEQGEQKRLGRDGKGQRACKGGRRWREERERERERKKERDQQRRCRREQM